MAGIPGGSFKLGEMQTLSGYCLDLTEVTVAAYQKCVEADGCTEPDAYVKKANDWAQFCNWKNPGRGTHPINCVDWNQATTYCAWAQKRLPTEAEWEWAARNGDKGDTYPWGAAAPDGSQANACGSECVSNMKTKMSQDWSSMYPADDGWAETAPVVSFPKGDNRWGVHDLAGNVGEWTSSKSDAKSPARVRRGGGWRDNGAMFLSASSQVENTPSFRLNNLGFRCARTP